MLKDAIKIRERGGRLFYVTSDVYAEPFFFLGLFRSPE
jgi:hypothetical protein